MTPSPTRDAATLLSTDSATIRAWAHKHDLFPVRHREDGHLSLQPDQTGGDRYERVSWEVFGVGLSKKEYVVRYHGAGHEAPVEVVDREVAIQQSNVERSDLEARLDEGQTVTSEPPGGPDGTASTEDESTAVEGGDGDRTRSDQPGDGHASADRATSDSTRVAASEDAQSAPSTRAGGGTQAAQSSDEGDDPGVTTADVGTDVVDAAGQTVGMVTAVDEAERTIYVAREPSLTDRIKAVLELGGADVDDVPIGMERVDSVSRDAITLNSTGDLDELRPAP